MYDLLNNVGKNLNFFLFFFNILYFFIQENPFSFVLIKIFGVLFAFYIPYVNERRRIASKMFIIHVETPLF